MELCERCGENEVPNKKYFCLSCICVADGCRNVVRIGNHCSMHSCGRCEYEKGAEYITVTGKFHKANIHIAQNIQYYIDFDICSATVDNRQCRCDYRIHNELCNKYANKYPKQFYDKYGFSKCRNLNICNVTGCGYVIDNYDLMRCSNHYSKCRICYKCYIDEEKKYPYACPSCTRRKLVKCSNCYGIFPPHFTDGHRCLFHVMRKINSAEKINLIVTNGIIVNINEEITNIIKYYFALHTKFTRNIPAEFSHLFALPKDLFYLIMQKIITSAPTITLSHYFSIPISCSEITIKK